MSVNFTDNEQNSISLMNVSYYDSKADYMADTFADVTEETGAADFTEQMERGFIQDITCGTYNGASKDFTPWELSDNNILATIYEEMHESDFINDMLINRDVVQEDWDNDDYIREYTEVYEVFIIGGRVYVNQD